MRGSRGLRWRRERDRWDRRGSVWRGLISCSRPSRCEELRLPGGSGGGAWIVGGVVAWATALSLRRFSGQLEGRAVVLRADLIELRKQSGEAEELELAVAL